MNYVNVYRMEHRQAFYGGLSENIGIGPYMFCQELRNKFIFDTLPKEIQDLNQKLLINEERPRYLKRNIAPGKCLPATASYLRPGPREDIGLREYFKNHYLGGGDINSTTLARVDDPFVFCFDSFEQANRWFFDCDELDLLKICGFHLVKRRVPSTQAVFGHAQGLLKIKDWVKTP